MAGSENTTPLPLSRRALLGGAAVLAVTPPTAAPAVVPDPVIALVARWRELHRLAVEAERQAIARRDILPASTNPLTDATCSALWERHQELRAARNEVRGQIIATPATTPAGALAKIETLVADGYADSGDAWTDDPFAVSALDDLRRVIGQREARA